MILKNDENGREIEVKTPIFANLLPAIGFGIGLAVAVVKKEEKIEKILSYAFFGGLIGSVPKAIYLFKGFSTAIKEDEKYDQKPGEEPHEPVEYAEEVIDTDAEASNDNYENASEPVEQSQIAPAETSEIIYYLEKMSETNNTLENWLPRKEHFEARIDGFSQDKKNALCDMLELFAGSEVSDEPTEEQLRVVSEKLNAIESHFGENIIKEINEELDEINEVISEEFEVLTPSVAA